MLQPLRIRLARRKPCQRALIRSLTPDHAENPEIIDANFENWVRMWVDLRPAGKSDCGKIIALRGVSWDGQALWLIRHADKRFGYHATAPTPQAAIAEATAAWAERRRVRRHWPTVRRIARDLALGRRRMEVRLEDAHASALCTVGIEAFLRRIGLGRYDRVSGRMAAMMMLLEPQVGFVILAAHERVNGRLPDEPPPSDHNRGLRLA